MRSMSPSEWRAFLLGNTRTAKLATVRADGRPHVAPVWFDLDGDELIFTTSTESAKGKNILRDPRVMISVDDEHPPFAFVSIEGTAIAVENSEHLLFWTTRLARRYMGNERADAYGKRNAGPGELLIRVPLTKIVAQQDVAG